MIGNDEPVASEPGEVIANADWYDYEAKYTEGGMELVVPARITAAQRERVRRLAVEAFVGSGCTGMARVDFFVTDQGQVLVNELNTIPGFTATSVFARLFEASGVPYVELLERLLGYALERYEPSGGPHLLGRRTLGARRLFAPLSKSPECSPRAPGLLSPRVAERLGDGGPEPPPSLAGSLVTQTR